MKIVCIDNSNRGFGITLYKIYDVVRESNWHFSIINDVGENYDYLKNRFKTLEEIREERINTILCYIPENK